MGKPPKLEEPRSEPEVIPPGHAGRGTERVRIYIGKPSPLAIGDIDHRPPIGRDVGSPVRRVPILVATRSPGRYWRNRCRAIAVLFSWALRPNAPGRRNRISGDLTGKLDARDL